MSCRSSTSESSSSATATPSRCSYCVRSISNDNYLTCQQCQGNVHIKCLRHASTPGDLLGDVFFDFTCSKCNDDVMLQFDGPSTSSSSTAPREKLVRQRLPWVMVITLAIHNLTVKSKGLSHHGYFHWRTHIVNFIDKNWDYLFEPMTRRRKKWIGSVSGSLSHNSPEFFLSGQEVFNESGWWKLTHSHLTPKDIFKLYEKQSLKRQQGRSDKRVLEETKRDYPIDVVKTETAPKRMRQADSEEEVIIPTHSCSRTIPYMGRKPKIARQLNIIDVDSSKNLNKQQSLEQQPVLNTVQSSLMDFLAENLASEDLMFQDLPNIVPEPIVSLGKNDEDLLQLIRESGEAPSNKNIENNFFDVPAMKNVSNLYDSSNNIKHESNDTNSFNLTLPGDTEDVDGKLKRFYLYQESQLQQQSLPTNIMKTNESKEFHGFDDIEDDVKNANYANGDDDDDDDDNDADDDDDDEEEYKPRIVQVTNFQEIEEAASRKSKSPVKAANKIKQESPSDVDAQSDNDDIAEEKSVNEGLIKKELEQKDDESSLSSVETKNKLEPCKPSLFTKRKQRNWPWLVEEEEKPNDEDITIGSNECIAMMSEYEEQEMLQKLRRIMNAETICNIEIPSYIRRFYRKLCIRAWKREHSKPLFNLDDFIDPARRNRMMDRNKESKTQHIDRYQLLARSTVDERSSFYARIAGSFHYELFESPYSQRILHPFIFRSKECFPPWLKLMCELQYTVNKTLPSRASIDYCYVRPNHIAAVNALLQSVFWPGIDMTECLSYPDFSVVALYKKLVVGCGFLVPDVGYNEAYISFMAVRPDWQRSGIGTFMLYHLIQTCMSKDITLHVSATNPAIVLYQKFGFKIEEVILDFYDKYLPLSSKQSRNAFFLRLMR